MCLKLEEFAHNGPAWPNHLAIPQPIPAFMCVARILNVPRLFSHPNPQSMHGIYWFLDFLLGPTIANSVPNVCKSARSPQRRRLTRPLNDIRHSSSAPSSLSVFSIGISSSRISTDSRSSGTLVGLPLRLLRASRGVRQGCMECHRGVPISRFLSIHVDEPRGHLLGCRL